ncbi:hypothetical protein [Methylocystis parvus]|uniref:Uncharacterized protein n=1 Tax=Methylocystis parvus TaxID=134 RepID=A0A6B8M8Z9_9HYPH|nr:hypothetical protein [Methylocystis parvus]QGM97773.1 hypothetical protein F7D14_10025 [Methylocystis parvus]WBK01923.1 hypothetical protein MMG94_09560 [Methylocystis parvus OBBP]
MFHVFLVKIGASPVGIVANAAGGFRFYAIEQSFHELESLVFDSAEDARSAAVILSGSAVSA